MDNVATPPVAAPARRSTATYVAWTCGIALAVVVCLCLVMAALSVGLIAYITPDPKGLAVESSLPFAVKQGETFELVLHLSNTGSQPFTVGDIDLDQAMGGSILDGAIVLNTDPPMERDYSIPGIKTFHYDRPIAPGATNTVRFILQATSQGEFGGSIGIYVGARFKQIDATITVSGE